MKIQFVRLVSAILVVFFAFSTKISAAPGDLDTTFNGIGYLRQSLGLLSGPATATVIQPDGKIIVVGSALIDGGNGNDAVVIRYNPDGTLDNTFDFDGIADVSLGGGENFLAVALQPDGKIVAVGRCQLPGLTVDFLVARFDSNGRLDRTFDFDGIVNTNIKTNSFDIARAVAVQPNGKIVVVGSVNVDNETDFVTVRYNADGSLDTTFNVVGMIVRTISTGAGDRPTSVAIQLDGKILVFGNTNGNHILIRYNPNGSADTGFEDDGTIIGPPMTAGGVAVQWDGKIVVAGHTAFPFDFALIRYNPNGTYDTTFDSDGLALTNISGVSDDYLTSVALQPDGKIITAGYSHNIVTQAAFSIVRYNADGSLDTSWGNGGKVISDFPGSQDNAWGVASAPGGKIMVVGYMNEFGMARYQGSPIVPAAKISGRVVNSQGKGISGAKVTLSNAPGGTKTVSTNPFGYYNFPNLPTGANYTVSVSSKRSEFYQKTQAVGLYMDVLGLHFIGTAP